MINDQIFLDSYLGTWDVHKTKYLSKYNSYTYSYIPIYEKTVERESFEYFVWDDHHNKFISFME